LRYQQYRHPLPRIKMKQGKNIRLCSTTWH
jgi:hypothetical protein